MMALAGTPLNVNAESFDREVLEHSRPVLADFWSLTCGHCMRFNSEFDAAAEEARGQAKFVKVSAQEAMPLFQRFGVQATPTTIIFRGGVEIGRRPGFMPKGDLLTWMTQVLRAADTERSAA
jgi:thioredoxin 2